jgi:hypothetical protein
MKTERPGLPAGRSPLHPNHPIPGNALGDRSPRAPRRVWARLTPPPRFTSPAAVYLEAWAVAIVHLETWAKWCAAHPEGDPL